MPLKNARRNHLSKYFAKPALAPALGTELSTWQRLKRTGLSVGANATAHRHGHPNDDPTNSDNRRITAFNRPFGVTFGVCNP